MNVLFTPSTPSTPSTLSILSTKKGKRLFKNTCLCLKLVSARKLTILQCLVRNWRSLASTNYLGFRSLIIQKRTISLLHQYSYSN